MNKPAKKSWTSPEELIAQAGGDEIVEEMVRRILPLTRQTYIHLAWPDQPDNYEPGPEEEAMIPAPFRLWNDEGNPQEHDSPNDDSMKKISPMPSANSGNNDIANWDNVVARLKARFPGITDEEIDQMVP